MKPSSLHIPASCALFALLTTNALALDPTTIRTPPQEAGRSAEVQLQALQLPDGFSVRLFADEKLLANPVCLYPDEQGSIYVVESLRQSRGVEDNRSHPWINDDLAAMTVEDRLAMFEKYADRFQGGMEHFTRHDDRILRFADTTGDGVADEVQVYADGFNEAPDGTMAGLLIKDGTAWVTNIPHLWRLRDTTGDGVADEREALLSGFGVKVALRGHDMHGLVWGPDGRLYFSIGDRGFHVVNREGELLADPNTGAVFRCEPDGSGLEVIHRGLRNPQELAFDAYGNLFTGDNNSDAGDAARLVHIVDGGETGWDMAYQSMSGAYSRGVFHMDGIWWEEWEPQPAWVLPPVAHVNSGPAGFVYYPGTGLPEQYDGHFFLCDFRGNASNSGIWAFSVEPAGAGFTMQNHHQFMGETLPTDVDFTYDGRMVLTDFVQGWGDSDLGRIYIVQHDETVATGAGKELATLFAEGFVQRDAAELAGLLAHRDMRVRQRAQFALAARGAEGLDTLRQAAVTPAEDGDELSRLRRLHGIWGLGQLQRAGIDSLAGVAGLLADNDPEIRAQMARAIGDNGFTGLTREVVGLLADDEPRVRFHAALALGRVAEAGGPGRDEVLTLIEQTGAEDRTLRHAAVMALRGVLTADQMAELAGHGNADVRLAALLALAMEQDNRVALFLRDESPWIVLEAAAAINRLDLEGAWSALAELAGPLTDDASAHGQRLRELPDENRRRESLLRRVINAGFRLGAQEGAEGVVGLAVLRELPDAVRIEAVRALAAWEQPGPRDRVEGVWRPVGDGRDPAAGATVVRARLADMVAASEGDLLAEVLKVAADVRADPEGIDLNGMIADASQNPNVRLAALRFARQVGGEVLDLAVADAMASGVDELEAAGAEALAQLDPAQAILVLQRTLAEGRLPQRQLALATLARIGSDDARGVVRDWLERLVGGGVEAGLQLDVIEAARELAVPAQEEAESADPAMAALLERWQRERDAEGPLAALRVSMEGGNPVAGRDVLENHLAAQCMRCHKLDGNGGDAGPALDGVAARLDVEKIWESLVDPAAEIAEGYGLDIVTLKDGAVVVGRVLGEADGELEVATLAGINQKVAVADVASTDSQDVSSMPAMGGILTPTELRDLVAFLATLE